MGDWVMWFFLWLGSVKFIFDVVIEILFMLDYFLCIFGFMGLEFIYIEDGYFGDGILYLFVFVLLFVRGYIEDGEVY